MPELPEVAGLAGFLNEQLQGAVFTKLQIVSFAVLKTADPPFLAWPRTMHALMRPILSETPANAPAVVPILSTQPVSRAALTVVFDPMKGP